MPEIVVGWTACLLSFAAGAMWASGRRDHYIEELETIIRKLTKGVHF